MIIDSRMEGTLELVINGALLGAGGAGGSRLPSYANKDGKAGGVALEVQTSGLAPIHIINNGIFAGGGGGGGLGGYDALNLGNAGGGGMGDIGGAAGDLVVPDYGFPAQSGTSENRGLGAGINVPYGAGSNNGGGGGYLGANGEDGYKYLPTDPNGVGGAGGKRIDGKANVLYVVGNGLTRENDI